jgi:hypothetical protein
MPSYTDTVVADDDSATIQIADDATATTTATAFNVPRPAISPFSAPAVMCYCSSRASSSKHSRSICVYGVHGDTTHYHRYHRDHPHWTDATLIKE